MGRIIHDAIIATTHDCRPGGLPDIDAFRASLPEDFRSLVIGPIPAYFNGYVSYAFLPDGSKEGWTPSNEGDEYRRRFAALFDQRYDDGSSHDEVVAVRYGEDHRDQHGTPAAHYIEDAA
jgi:hypothetical protein